VVFVLRLLLYIGKVVVYVLQMELGIKLLVVNHVIEKLIWDLNVSMMRLIVFEIVQTIQYHDHVRLMENVRVVHLIQLRKS
jgi:hypothetical protein